MSLLCYLNSKVKSYLVEVRGRLHLTFNVTLSHGFYQTLNFVTIYAHLSGSQLDTFHPIFSQRERYVCFTHSLVFGNEKERLTVHLWAVNEGVTLKKRGGRSGEAGARDVPRRCKPLQFSLECLSLGLNPHTPPPNCFRLKFLYSARPCAPLLPQRSAHTKGHSKRINTKSMGNSEKSKKNRKRKKKISLAT